MRNKVPWVVGGVLIVVLAIGALVATSSKKSASKMPPPPESARAVVLPANQSRTVVIPPCNTPVSDTARVAGGGRRTGTPGATAFELPQEQGVHTLLVPHCQPTKTGSVNAEGSIPSAAFILPNERRLTKDREGKIHYQGVIAESQLILPDRSKVATVVVPACTKKEGSKGRDIVLGADRGNAELVVAPSC